MPQGETGLALVDLVLDARIDRWSGSAESSRRWNQNSNARPVNVAFQSIRNDHTATEQLRYRKQGKETYEASKTKNTSIIVRR